MDLPIALTLIVIVLTLLAFIREWAAPDVIALTVLCLVVALGLVDMTKFIDVFKNEAPITIAALFVIGAALEQSGAVDHLGRMMKNRLSGKIRPAIFSFAVVTAFFSAWMNNTAIVAILLPVTLGFARSKNIPASKLLMPLSYCSILGGCSTLIGTSTNILVNGSLKDLKMEPMGMFELAPVGIPLTIAGIAYLVLLGPKLIPARSSISGTLEISERTTPLHHILISPQSPLVGCKLVECALFDRTKGIHLMEIRRNGARVRQSLNELKVEANDRYLIALHRRSGKATKPEQLFKEIGAELLSNIEGLVTELVIRDESTLIGQTFATAEFRQKYNSVVLAVHRDGVNITSSLAKVPLAIGDTLLVITPLNNLEALAESRDFVMTDSPEDAPQELPVKPRHHVWLSWGVLVGVVLVATLADFFHESVSWVPDIPIHYAALVGALVLLWLKVLTPREAYSGIDWQVLLMLYGLLGLGLAMQQTGTAKWLASSLVQGAQHIVTPGMLPIVMLWLIFLLTLLLTEVLSNNATAVMMVPIVVTMAEHLHVNSRPYIMAVTVAASTAFALPMGYQTHLMVYGPGGYRFSDFLKVGIPLNFICWVTACTVIPLVWPF